MRLPENFKFIFEEHGLKDATEFLLFVMAEHPDDFLYVVKKIKEEGDSNHKNCLLVLFTFLLIVMAKSRTNAQNKAEINARGEATVNMDLTL